MTLAEVLATLNLINATLPELTGLILMLQKSDGTTTVLNALDAAEAQNEINIAEAQAFIDQNKGIE